MFSVTYEVLKDESSFDIKKDLDHSVNLGQSFVKEKPSNQELFKSSTQYELEMIKSRRFQHRRSTADLRVPVIPEAEIKKDHFFTETFLNNLTSDQAQTIDLNLYLEACNENPEKDYPRRYIHWYLLKDQSHFMTNELQDEVHFAYKRAIFSPTDPHIAAACYDTSLLIWDHERCQAVKVPLKTHQSKITALCYSHNGRRVASINKKKGFIVWDLTDISQSNMLTIDAVKEKVKTMAYSPDDSKIALGTVEGNLMIFDANIGELLLPATQIHEAKIKAICFSPDGQRIATGGEDKLILLWDIKTKQVLKRLKGHRNEVLVVKFNNLGDRIVSGGKDKNVLVWNVEQGRELFDPMKGHKNAISCIAISPDGLRFASGSRDKMVIFWDMSMGKSVAGPIEGHSSAIQDLKYSEDGKMLFSVSGDNAVVVWDTIRCEVRQKPVHSYAINSSVCAITPDGLTLIMANGKKQENDATFTVWNTVTVQALSASIKAHKDTIKVMACSPNSKLLVTGSRDKKVAVWNLEKTNEVLYGPLEGHSEEITAIVYSSDNKTFATGAKNAEIRVWDTFKGAPGPFEYAGHQGKINCLAFSSDGRMLVSGGFDQKVNVWNVLHGKKIMGYTHEARVSAVAFSEDCKRVASASEDGRIIVYDIEGEEKEPLTIRGHLNAVTAMVFSHDGLKIATAGTAAKTEKGHEEEIKIWQFGKDALKLFIGPLLGHKLHIFSLSFANDDGSLFSVSPDCKKTWRISCVNSVKTHKIENSFDVSPDGRRIVAPGEKNTDLLIYDSSNGKTLIHIMRSHLLKVNFAYFSPDSNKMVSGSDDCSLMLWEVDSGKTILGPLKGHIAPVRVACFSKNGHKLASSGADKTVIIWDAQTGKPLFEPLEGHHEDVYTMEFSYDGYRLVTGGDDGKIIIWDALNGRKVMEPIEAHEDWITCVRFLEDGLRIFSSSFDTTIKIWNADNGELIETLKNHTQSVYCLKFSKDQTKMISASNDKKAIVFDSNSLCNCKFNRETVFKTGVKAVHWSTHNDLFFVFDEEIQCFFNYFSNESIFFSKGLILSDFYRNPDKFSDDELINIVNGNIGEIVPFYYTFLHVVAYTDDHQRFFKSRVLKLLKIKNKTIDFLAFFKKDIHDMSCMDIILKKNNKNLIQIVLKYIAKSYYPSQLYAQGFVDKITVALLNQILEIFGEDTSLIIKLLDFCFDRPVDFPDLFIYKGFQRDFSRTMPEPRMITPKLEGYIAEDELNMRGWLRGLLAPEVPFQTQEIVSAKTLYLRDMLSLDKGDGLEFFRNMANLQSDNPIFDNDTFHKLIHYKWETYAKRIYFKEAGWFVTLMLCFLINSAYILPYRVSSDHDIIYDQVSLVLDFLIMLLNMRYAFRELSQMCAFGLLAYFVSVWNYLDIVLIVGIFLGITLDSMYCLLMYTETEVLKVIDAYIIFLLFVRFMSYARGIKGTSFMIRLVMQVLLDIRSFLFLMMVFIIALAYSTYMLQTDLTADHFSTFNTFFREMLGDLTDYDELSVAYYYALWVFFFIASIILSIVLMNLLISIISDTFANVKNNETLARHYEMCNILYDIDAELNIKRPFEYYTYIHAETGHKAGMSELDVLKEKVQEATGMIKNIDYHLEMMLNKDGLTGYDAKIQKKAKRK